MLVSRIDGRVPQMEMMFVESMQRAWMIITTSASSKQHSTSAAETRVQGSAKFEINVAALITSWYNRLLRPKSVFITST